MQLTFSCLSKQFACYKFLLGTINKEFITETRGVGNNRTCGIHPNKIIIKIIQNTEKSPGDIRRLVVSQTPIEKLSVNASEKLSDV